MSTPGAVGPISDLSGRVAVVTGGGTGIGRELTRQLAAAGCDVAICDIAPDSMDETVALAALGAATGVRLTTFVADVAERVELDAFAAHVAATFDTDAIDLVFNNAGVAGAGSFVNDGEAGWDKVFGVCWGGVLHGTRAFLPMLLGSARGHVVNIASINAMWACLGPNGPHTAYSAAKSAVKGFTEALIVDFRVNAPHLTASVVLPGHIGTAIMRHSFQAHGRDPHHLGDEHVAELRGDLAKRGIDVSAASNDEIRSVVAMRIEAFEHDAPTTAADAATRILDGVRAGEWRILVGADAVALDKALRADPTAAYDPAFTDHLTARGHLTGLITP